MKRALKWAAVGFALGLACGGNILLALALTLASTVIGALQ